MKYLCKNNIAFTRISKLKIPDKRTSYSQFYNVPILCSGNSASVLPTNAVAELSNRSTAILNRVQQFLSHHLIDTYGCDYSSSGLTTESIQSKLRLEHIYCFTFQCKLILLKRTS